MLQSTFLEKFISDFYLAVHKLHQPRNPYGSPSVINICFQNQPDSLQYTLLLLNKVKNCIMFLLTCSIPMNMLQTSNTFFQRTTHQIPCAGYHERAGAPQMGLGEEPSEAGIYSSAEFGMVHSFQQIYLELLVSLSKSSHDFTFNKFLLATHSQIQNFLIHLKYKIKCVAMAQLEMGSTYVSHLTQEICILKRFYKIPSSKLHLTIKRHLLFIIDFQTQLLKQV